MVQALEPRKWMHKHISVWRGLKDSSVWGVFKQSFSVVASNLLRQLAKGGGERLSILSCVAHSKIGNSLYYSPASPEIVIAARGKRRNLLGMTEYLSLPYSYSWYGPVKRLSEIRRLSSEFAMAAVGFVTHSLKHDGGGGMMHSILQELPWHLMCCLTSCIAWLYLFLSFS